jgi:RNA 3'-terminal phosphate cyclase (ATP)
MTAMIEIDGSYGEGGGQILRTALSLSSLSNRPFRMVNIRKGRQKPGLMPQHLVAVRAAQLISGADVAGAAKGATELTFIPREVRGGDFTFDIGTAGATALVLQTIIPPLLFTKMPSRVTLTGGTHVPYSPSFDYLAAVFAPTLGKMGLEIRLSIDSYGFYPKGGGKVLALIGPARGIRPLRAEERGKLLAVRGYSAVGNLPLSIAERQKTAALEAIRGGLNPVENVRIELRQVPTLGEGTFTFLLAEAEDAVAGFTALGERGKRAETVGRDAAEGLLRHCRTAAALDPHLADQLVLYLALCPEESAFSTSVVTPHLITNLWVTGLFQRFCYHLEGKVGEPGRLKLRGGLDSS